MSKPPFPGVRFRALERATPIDSAALERVSAEERTARQKRDSDKRRADRQPGEIVPLKAHIPAPIKDAIEDEAHRKKCSLSHLVTTILEAHLASGALGPKAQRPPAPTPSYTRPKPR
jgi:hypothetical protein